MYPITQVGLATGQLTDDELKYIDTKIVETVRPLLVGRKLFPTVAIGGAGPRQIHFYTETDMGQALIDMEGQEESHDAVSLTESYIKLPIIHKEFTLLWRDILARRSLGQALDTQHASNAARQVAEEEDKLLLSGENLLWRCLGIQGMTSITGRNTEASAGSWATQANIFTDINDAIEELETDGYYGPYKLICTPAMRKVMRVLVTNNDEWVIDRIAEILGGSKEDSILVSTSIVAADDGLADSAIVCQPGADNFDLVVGADVQNRIREENNGNLWGRVWEAVVPRFKRPASICEITTVATT